MPKPGGDSVRPTGPPQGEGWGAGSAALTDQLPHGAATDPGEGPSVSISRVTPGLNFFHYFSSPLST